MAWKHWNEDMVVKICGVNADGEITLDGRGCCVFVDLEEAQTVFPDLDPERSSDRFTWAMKGRHDNQDCIRFETDTAERIYSA